MIATRLRRRRAALFVPALLLALVLPTAAAAGGGWWSFIPLDREVVAVGEEIRTDSAEVLFESRRFAEDARSGRERFFAYLIPDFDWRIVHEAMGESWPGDWWVQPRDALPTGTVEVRGGTSNLVRIRVRLDVPSVQPGEYALMLCTEGCEEPLADVVPSRVVITADPAVAEMSRRLNRLEHSGLRSRHRLQSRIRPVERAVERLALEDADAAGRVDALEARITDLETAVRRAQRETSWPAWAGWGAAAAALILVGLLGRRRRREPRREDPHTSSRPRPPEGAEPALVPMEIADPHGEVAGAGARQ